MQTTEVQNLFEFIPSELSEKEGYCTCPRYLHKEHRMNVSYLDWEEHVATPALKKAGFCDIQWIRGERDSFGPLSRVARCMKDGKLFFLMYG